VAVMETPHHTLVGVGHVVATYGIYVLIIHQLGRNAVGSEIPVVVYRELEVGPVPLVVAALVYGQIGTGTMLPVCIFLLTVGIRLGTQFVHSNLARLIIVAAVPIVACDRLTEAEGFGNKIEVFGKPRCSYEVAI